MSWTVTPLDTLDLERYDVLPFGEHGQALPFVRAFFESGARMSDALALDSSATASLKRALCSFANVEPNVRPMLKNGKTLKNKNGTDRTVKTYKREHVARACESLHVAIRALAKNGTGEREYVALVRTDTDES